MMSQKRRRPLFINVMINYFCSNSKMGLFAIVTSIKTLVVINTVATTALAGTSLYEHREQLSEAVQTVADTTKSVYRATKDVVKSAASTTARAYTRTKHYIQNKLNGYEEHYGQDWSLYD